MPVDTLEIIESLRNARLDENVYGTSTEPVQDLGAILCHGYKGDGSITNDRVLVDTIQPGDTFNLQRVNSGATFLAVDSSSSQREYSLGSGISFNVAKLGANFTRTFKTENNHIDLVARIVVGTRAGHKLDRSTLTALQQGAIVANNNPLPANLVVGEEFIADRGTHFATLAQRGAELYVVLSISSSSIESGFSIKADLGLDIAAGPIPVANITGGFSRSRAKSSYQVTHHFRAVGFDFNEAITLPANGDQNPGLVVMTSIQTEMARFVAEVNAAINKADTTLGNGLVAPAGNPYAAFGHYLFKCSPWSDLGLTVSIYNDDEMERRFGEELRSRNYITAIRALANIESVETRSRLVKGTYGSDDTVPLAYAAVKGDGVLAKYPHNFYRSFHQDILTFVRIAYLNDNFVPKKKWSHKEQRNFDEAKVRLTTSAVNTAHANKHAYVSRVNHKAKVWQKRTGVSAQRDTYLRFYPADNRNAGGNFTVPRLFKPKAVGTKHCYFYASKPWFGQEGDRTLVTQRGKKRSLSFRIQVNEGIADGGRTETYFQFFRGTTNERLYVSETPVATTQRNERKLKFSGSTDSLPDKFTLSKR